MEADSTLCFGPLWDEDLGWNNNREIDLATKLIAEETAISGNPNYRPLSEATRKLWQDPWFANAVTVRLNRLVKRGVKEFLLNKVDSLAQVIEQTQQQNYRIWPISRSSLSNFDRYYSYRNYSEYVQQLKDLINQRIDYLVGAFADRNKNNRYIDENADLPIVAESGVNVVLRRTAKAGVWTTVCLPFALSESEVKRFFGNGVKVATLSSVSGGLFSFWTQSQIQMNAGSPYLVMPSLDVDVPFSFQNVSTTAYASRSYVSGHLFIGTFKPTKLGSDLQTYALDDEGNLVHPSASDAPMPGFRAYLTTKGVMDITGFSVNGVKAGDFVVKPVKGDVNGDGQITIADVTALVNIVLGKDSTEPHQYNHNLADINGDGEITIADVTALVNKILGK